MQELEKIEAYKGLDYFPRKVHMAPINWLEIANVVLVSDRKSAIDFAGRYELGEYIDNPKRIFAERFEKLWFEISRAVTESSIYWIEIMPFENDVIKGVAGENFEFGNSNLYSKYEQLYNRETRILERLRAEKERIKKHDW